MKPPTIHQLINPSDFREVMIRKVQKHSFSLLIGALLWVVFVMEMKGGCTGNLPNAQWHIQSK